MKCRDVFLYITIALTGSLIVCGNGTSPEQGDDPVIDERSFIGSFVDTLPAKDEYNMPYPIVIGIDISEENDPIDSTDSTFLLYSMEIPANKYLYKHNGIWGFNGTIITLSGKHCEMIDVTTGSDTLEPQHDSINLKTIDLDTVLVADGEWEQIMIINLGSVVRSIPWYNTPFQDLLLGVLVDLKKKDSVVTY